MLTFQSSASNGAVLIMPDETYQNDLKNLDRFYQHIGQHAESWYDFANGPRMGRRVGKTGLCLVIGCDKTSSWGIATFSDSSEHTTSQLHWAKPSSEPGCSYSWQHSGIADVRVGPGQGDAVGLESQAESRPVRNQCLFVRYLTFKLRESAWPGFGKTNGVEIRMESHQPHSLSNTSKMSSSHGSSTKSSSVFSRFLGSFFRSDKTNSNGPAQLTEDRIEIAVETYSVSVGVYLIQLISLT